MSDAQTEDLSDASDVALAGGKDGPPIPHHLLNIEVAPSFTPTQHLATAVDVEIDLESPSSEHMQKPQDEENQMKEDGTTSVQIDEEDNQQEEKEDENTVEEKEQKEPLIEDGENDNKHDVDHDVDDATLPLPVKKPLPDDTTDQHEETGSKSKVETPSLFLHPIDRLRQAWKQSTSVLEFFIRATCIIFASVGWLFLVGGVPLISIVQLIIGSIYLGNCPAEPRIPKYLIVSGVFGTILHCISVITKYAPRNKKWPTRDQRRRCICFEILLQVFLLIWFLAGCSWVYGIYEPEYDKEDQDNYCQKTVYLFTFWIFNLSFIVLALIFAIGTCCIICIAVTPSTDKNKEKNVTDIYP